jgi:glycosyltransferase involved in cell wall biosynthesis
VGGEAAERHGVVTVEPWCADAAPLLAAALLVLIPSRTEGLPLVLLEAWTLARTVIASRLGGILEVAEDGVTAVLPQAGDLAAWQDAVASLLAEPDRRRELAHAGHARWEAELTATAMAERFAGLVKPLLRRGSASRSLP